MAELSPSNKQLPAENLLFRALYDGTSDGAVIVDKGDNIVSVNRRALELFGYTEDEIYALKRLDLLAESEHLDSAQKKDLIWSGAMIPPFERVMRHKNGRHVLVEMNLILVRDEDGHPCYTLSLIRDITERKRVEQEQEQMIDTLSAYAHTVAHDLKAPLSIVMGFADLLQDMLPDAPEDVKGILPLMVDTSRNAIQIVDELLLFASIRGVNDVPKEALNMQESLDRALARLAPMIDEHHAQITQLIPLPWVCGYGQWVDEIWVNFINNAVKYGGKPPIITINAVPQGAMMCFEVTDNGSGLTTDEQDLLFKRFSRLEKHAKITGHGLGLSIVYRIVERLGGEVGVESQVGKGSTFHFTLPISEFDEVPPLLFT